MPKEQELNIYYDGSLTKGLTALISCDLTIAENRTLVHRYVRWTKIRRQMKRLTKGKLFDRDRLPETVLLAQRGLNDIPDQSAEVKPPDIFMEIKVDKYAGGLTRVTKAFADGLQETQA